MRSIKFSSDKRQLTSFSYLKTLHLSPKRSSVLTNWRTVCRLFNYVWECPYRIIRATCGSLTQLTFMWVARARCEWLLSCLGRELSAASNLGDEKCLSGRPHENALLPCHAKMHMYCIVLADRPHGSWKCSNWKCTFLKTGLRVEKSENAALLFSCGRRIRILSKTMTSSPHPSTSSLRPLKPAMSHNNNNNNGGLLLVFVFLATYSPCSQVWVATAVQPRYRFTQMLLVSLH